MKSNFFDDKSPRAMRIFQLMEELNRLRKPPEEWSRELEAGKYGEDEPGMKKGGKVRGAGRARKGIRPAK